MREILFKAKVLNGDRIVFGNLIADEKNETFWILEKNDYPVNTTGYGNILSALYKVDPSAIYEYTGFKDKFNNKIFEGDILREIYTKRDCYIDGLYPVFFNEITKSFCINEAFNKESNKPTHYSELCELDLSEMWIATNKEIIDHKSNNK